MTPRRLRHRGDNTPASDHDQFRTPQACVGVGGESIPIYRGKRLERNKVHRHSKAARVCQASANLNTIQRLITCRLQFWQRLVCPAYQCVFLFSQVRYINCFNKLDQFSVYKMRGSVLNFRNPLTDSLEGRDQHKVETNSDLPTPPDRLRYLQKYEAKGRFLLRSVTRTSTHKQLQEAACTR